MEQLFMKIAIVCDFLLLILSRGNCTEYNCTDAGLTSIPSDIPSDAKVVNLDKNQLSKIRQEDFNRKFPHLAELSLNQNQITSIERGCSRAHLCL
jgi:Leucine-rich repeat (LRR) protein